MKHCTDGLGPDACLSHASAVLSIAHTKLLCPMLAAQDEGEYGKAGLMRTAREEILRAQLAIKLALQDLEADKA